MKQEVPPSCEGVKGILNVFLYHPTPPGKAPPPAPEGLHVQNLPIQTANQHQNICVHEPVLYKEPPSQAAETKIFSYVMFV